MSDADYEWKWLDGDEDGYMECQAFGHECISKLNHRYDFIAWLRNQPEWTMMKTKFIEEVIEPLEKREWELLTELREIEIRHTRALDEWVKKEPDFEYLAFGSEDRHATLVGAVKKTIARMPFDMDIGEEE